MAEDGKHVKIIIGLFVFAAILLVRIFYIQMVDGSYAEGAVRNAMVYEPINPTRGIIYDRNGTILVGNKVAYDIMVTPHEVQAFDTLALADALGLEPEFIREKMDEFNRNRSSIGFNSVVLLKGMSAEDYVRFEEVRYKFPGIKGQVRSIREYPVNAGGNLLGYVSEVDPAYIARHPEYKVGDEAGKTGIEAAREVDLRGEKGYHIYLRNAHNQIAVPGKDIVTTIDATLQQYGQELMKDKAGSIVAIEPATGEILAMVSSPGIDVSQLAEIGKYYNELSTDPYKPMFNRAVQSSYPPGSVFKLVNGLIGLEEGVLTPDTKYGCDRGYSYGNGKKLGCHGHRSPLNLEEAVMMSCNGYFCHVLKTILENKKYATTEEAFDKWNAYVHSFGFGEKLGSDFPSELGGNIPTSAYYNKVYGKGRWRFSTILSISIGQGEVGLTPLHIANLCATVANRGYYIIPHIIKASEGVEIDPKYYEKHYTMVSPEQFNKVVGGMWRAVNSGYGSGGTASIAAVPGLDICGKTGTAQNPRGDDNSVFICFAPKDDPKIAVAAYVENGGFGARFGAPIASLMVEKYLNGSIEGAARKELENKMMTTSLMHKVKKN